jgi:pSer/pThr/pTyr-binding forkhead associated (FHA) protein
VYRLVIEDDEGRATVVPLIREELSIGRKEGNTIRLTERNVSRRHARVFRENNLFYVEDLGSYNGVRINGEKIAGRRPLREGDLIRIGDYQLSLHRDAAKTLEPQRLDAQPASRSPVRAHAKTDPMGVQEDEAPPTPPAEPPTLRISPPEATRAVGAALDVPRLVVLTPGVGVSEIPLTRDAVTLGREAEVSIAHRTLEREHARIVVEGGEVRVQDLGGGVRVNGEPQSVALLREGDLLELGTLKLRFAASRPAAARPPPRPAKAKADEAEAAVEAAAEAAPAPAAPHDVAAITQKTQRDDLVDAAATTPRISRRMMILGAAVLGVLLLAIILYFSLRSSPEPTASSISQTPGPPTSPVAALPATPPPIPMPTPAPPPPLPAPAPLPEPQPVAEVSPRPIEAREVERPEPVLRRARARRFARAAEARAEARAAEGRVKEAPVPAPEPPEPRAEPKRVETRPEVEAPAAKTEEPPRREEATAPPEPPRPPPPPERKREEVGDSSAKRIKARELFQKGTKVLLSSPVEAVGIFRQALALDPKLADLHKNLGIAYSALENNEAAARHYRIYLKMRPNAADAGEVARLLEETKK